jgi:hypothetical protein
MFSLPAPARKEPVCNSDTVIHYERHRTFFKKHYTEMYLDLGGNQLDKSNLFTGKEHETASGFPKLNYSKSISFAMYAMYGRRFSKTFSIMSGLGMEWVNYRFSKDVTIREIDDFATQVPIESIFDNFSNMRKSKLAGTYLTVPLMLRINFSRSFFVAAGVSGGFNINTHTKIIFDDVSGDKHKYKDYNVHMNPFKYGYVLRAGFDWISLFANYSASPLFSKNEGPQVYPFTVGLSLKTWWW